MKLYVIHTCNERVHLLDAHQHRTPLTCACYAVSRDNAQLTMMCVEQGRVDHLNVHETAYDVAFSCSGTKGHYAVTRLRDADTEGVCNRE